MEKKTIYCLVENNPKDR